MKREKTVKTNQQKGRLVFISFFVLFFMLFILSVDFSVCTSWNSMSSVWKVYKIVVPSSFLILSILAVIFIVILKYKLKGVHDKPVKIKTIENESLEYLTFFMSYLLPLIGYSTDNDPRQFLITIILILLFALLFYKTGIYYKNPVFAILGYKLYNAKIDGFSEEGNIILLSKDDLKTGSYVKFIELDKKVWIAKEA